jgi:hypothetical protein
MTPFATWTLICLSPLILAVAVGAANAFAFIVGELGDMLRR